MAFHTTILGRIMILHNLYICYFTKITDNKFEQYKLSKDIKFDKEWDVFILIFKLITDW